MRRTAPDGGMSDGYDKLPGHASQEYLWWQAGAAAERQAHDEDVSMAAKEVRDVLEGLSKLDGAARCEDLALRLARIYCPDKLRRGFR